MKLEDLMQISRKFTLLYVEDDESIVPRVLKYLNKVFKTVVWAKDGQEGLERFRNEKFDIVLTDIYMPNMNGLEMLSEIKKISPDQNCIIVSAYSEPDLFVNSIKIGVDGYIIKPIEYEQMNSCLLNIIKKLQNNKFINDYQENLEALVEEKSEELMLFKKAIDSTSEGVVITKADGNQALIYANKSFEKITGYSQDDILGENLRILNDKNKEQKEIKDIRIAVEAKKHIQTELKNYTKDGVEFINKLTIDPICCTKDNEISHFIGIQEDITELKKQELRLKQSANVFENVTEGIILTDCNEIILDVNKSFCDITGFDRKDIIGEKASILKSGMQDTEFYKKMWESISNSGFWSGKIINRKKSDELYTSLLNISSIYDKGEVKSYIGVFTDISDILEYEKNLRDKDIMLIQQSKMASMGEMIDSISHQWKQPLSLISTQITGLEFKSEYGELKKEDIHAVTSNVMDTIKYMSETIDDFKNFFSPKKLKKHFYIDHTVDKLMKLISSKLKNGSIRVIQDISTIELYTYENELVQVLVNILNNASDALMESNIEEKLIFIDVSYDKNISTIVIKDTAGGIPNDIIDKVFDSRFTTKENTNGTGIGLYMAKKIIENSLNGSIVVKNENFTHNENNYSGACFTITIDNVNNLD